MFTSSFSESSTCFAPTQASLRNVEEIVAESSSTFGFYARLQEQIIKLFSDTFGYVFCSLHHGCFKKWRNSRSGAIESILQPGASRISFKAAFSSFLASNRFECLEGGTDGAVQASKEPAQQHTRPR